MTAYRALRFQTSSVGNAVVKNFEMVIPFLEGLKKSNPGSVKLGMRGRDLSIFTYFPVS
jgi:hypothetical protein